RAAAFAEDTVIVNTSAGIASISRDPGTEEELWDALVLGTRDYARKCGFKDAVLGLSGGIDSAVTAAIACEALGRDHVTGVLMPSPWTAGSSVGDASALAGRLGLRTRTVPISMILGAFENALAPAF